jgi:glycosyltransferase involved in cell wall biosynthesis
VLDSTLTLSVGHQSGRRYRVAVVAHRYGSRFAGGAERSLAVIADTLHQRGHAVEVFTSCTQAETSWTNELSEGTACPAGYPVHRFGIDTHDPVRYQDAVSAVLDGGSAAAAQAGHAFRTHSLHSRRLLDALERRRGEWDALIVGPYLLGLTADVAQAFPDQTLLVPCFHDEPWARLPVWQPAYSAVAGMLYHSAEEKVLGEVELGYNCPGAVVAGTFLDVDALGDAERGRARVGGERRYLVYCGRYLAQKGLALLLDYAQRYSAAHAERFIFVFLGQGSLPIPRASWCRDLGFVKEEVKRDILAGAAALIQLSRHESLSLVTLEAWAQGVPVLVNARCSVLAGQMRRCAGGQALESYEAFAAALDDLWQHPTAWQARGLQGQEYVRRQYGSQADFAKRLEAALAQLKLPLAERMRARGLERAARLDRPLWRERFAELVQGIMARPRQLPREDLQVQPRSLRHTVGRAARQLLVPVRVVNRGSHPALAEGPARRVLRSWVLTCRESGMPAVVGQGPATPLPQLLLPGATLAVGVPVPVPTEPGRYRVAMAAVPAGIRSEEPPGWRAKLDMELVVETEDTGSSVPGREPAAEAVRQSLLEAHGLARLPDDYLDVTQGWLATWKAWIKRKLLGNFKRAYVDVLARQQSQFNQRVLTALNELAESAAVQESLMPPSISRQQVEELTKRVEKLERLLRRERRRARRLSTALAGLRADPGHEMQPKG